MEHVRQGRILQHLINLRGNTDISYMKINRPRTILNFNVIWLPLRKQTLTDILIVNWAYIFAEGFTRNTVRISSHKIWTKFKITYNFYQ